MGRLVKKRDSFTAGIHYAGESCFLCRQLIRAEEKVRYYGGPFLMHTVCVQKILDSRKKEESNG